MQDPENAGTRKKQEPRLPVCRDPRRLPMAMRDGRLAMRREARCTQDEPRTKAGRGRGGRRPPRPAAPSCINQRTMNRQRHFSFCILDSIMARHGARRWPNKTQKQYYRKSDAPLDTRHRQSTCARRALCERPRLVCLQAAAGSFDRDPGDEPLPVCRPLTLLIEHRLARRANLAYPPRVVELVRGVHAVARLDEEVLRPPHVAAQLG